MSFWNTVDAAGVGATAKGISKLAGGLYDMGKMVNLSKKLPTIENHRLVTNLAKDPQTSAMSGVTPADAADLHNPAMHGPMAVDLTGAGDDAASSIVSMLDLQDARVARYNEVALREGVLTPDRELEVMKEAEFDIAKNRYVSEVSTERVPGGFVLNYTERKMVPERGALGYVEERLPEAPVKPQAQDNVARVEENIEKFKGGQNLRYKIRDAEEEKVGFITAKDKGDSIMVVQSEIKDKANQGKGLGIKAYTELADWAHSQGKALTSDSMVSTDAEKLYKAMEKRGYKVTMNPEHMRNPEGHLIAAKGEPVFKVEPPTTPTLTDSVAPYTEVSFTRSDVRKQDRVSFNVDDQGKVDADPDSEYVTSFLRADPNSRMKGRINKEFVRDAETINREQAKLIGTMQDMLKDAYSGLNSSSVAKIDAILVKGSKEGAEYSYKALQGMGLSSKEIKGYLGQRNVMHNLWKLENQKIVDTMKAEGTQVVKVGDMQTPARVFDDPEQARAAFLGDDPETFSITVLDDGLSTFKKGQRIDLESAGKLDKEQLEDAYRKGFKLARSRNTEGKFRYNDNTTNWALVKDKDVFNPEGQALLNKIPGYMPKARSDSFYFVKTSRKTDASNPREVAGKAKEREVTVAWADNMADAQRYAKELGEGHFVKFDREMTGLERSRELVLVRGGLFSGGRKAEELKYVGQDKQFDYEAPMDMMQRYINHIGKQVPAHLWRLGNEQRLLKRARQLMPGETMHNVYDILPRAEKQFTKGAKEYKYLEDMVNQIQNIAGIPSSDELAMAKQMERVGNAIEGVKGLKWLSKFFYRSAQNRLSIPDRIRGVTFTHMLGLYNPSQFLVQASGSFSAFAVNPISAIRAMPKTIGWHILDGFAKDPLAQKAAADWMRSKGLGEYADSYEIWSRSGFRESVVSSNSDFATMFGNKPYDAGVLQRLAANNTMFYQMGELTTSRASLATAVEWYKDLHKVNKVDLNDAEALKTIYSRAEQYRLNMSKANPSFYNKGWQGVPFQFQQVMSKYFEKILPSGAGGTSELNSFEKARLTAIPMAVIGMSGVPGATFIAEQIANFTGEDLTKLSPDEAKLFHGGAVGWMMSEAFNMNVDFASRMSLGTDIFKNLHDYASGGGSDILATLLGPSGSVATRYTQAAKYFWTALDVVKEGESLTTDELTVMGKVLADTLASIPSTTRQLKDYLPLILSDQQKYYKDGRFMWEFEDMNKQTALMAAFGFQPTETVDLYDLVNKVNSEKGRAQPETLKWTQDDAQVLTRLFATGILGVDREEAMALHNKFIKGIVDSYQDQEQTKLLDGIYSNMYKPKYEFEELFQKFRMENTILMEDGLRFINERVSRRYKEMEIE
jgi:hypothetical protein